VVVSTRVTMDVDTPQDLETVRSLLHGSGPAHREGG